MKEYHYFLSFVGMSTQGLQFDNCSVKRPLPLDGGNGETGIRAMQMAIAQQIGWQMVTILSIHEWPEPGVEVASPLQAQVILGKPL